MVSAVWRKTIHSSRDRWQHQLPTTIHKEKYHAFTEIRESLFSGLFDRRLMLRQQSDGAGVCAYRRVAQAREDRREDGNIQLQIITRREVDAHAGIRGFEHQLLDERGHAAIAHDAEAIGLLGTRAHTAGVEDVDANGRA